MWLFFVFMIKFDNARNISILGIVIMMFYNDHNPPHFHANYREYKVVINVENEIIDGVIPRIKNQVIFQAK